MRTDNEGFQLDFGFVVKLRSYDARTPTNSSVLANSEQCT